MYFEAYKKEKNEYGEGLVIKIKQEVGSKEEALKLKEANPDYDAYKLHYCYHDEDPNKPCKSEQIMKHLRADITSL